MSVYTGAFTCVDVTESLHMDPVADCHKGRPSHDGVPNGQHSLNLSVVTGVLVFISGISDWC